jgi:glyoxylase-like metal-dependent hydrolase (beta-lactamase superfamily II)
MQARMSLVLGPHRLDAVDAGPIAFDGGVVFGSVAQAKWGATFPPDERHRVHLSQRCLLVRTGDRVVLVDTGAGERWTEKERDLYSLDATGTTILERNLAALGVQPGDVTDVVLTHLHFDKAGGAVKRDAGGRDSPTFPEATYHVQRRNWGWAQRPSDLDRAAYRPGDFRALATAGQLHFVEGDCELLPGLSTIASEGHTIGLQLVRVECDDGWLVHCSDLVPTHVHLRPAWHMGYDLYPLTVVEEKKMLLAQALDDDGLLFLDHDPRMQACRVREEAGDVRAVPVTLT